MMYWVLNHISKTRVPFFFEFMAPGIGTIAFGLHNEFWHLKEARIDTLIIPDVSVGVKENSWEEIKRYWLNEKKKFTY